jgi:hypothetical protein
VVGEVEAIAGTAWDSLVEAGGVSTSFVAVESDGLVSVVVSMQQMLKYVRGEDGGEEYERLIESTTRIDMGMVVTKRRLDAA